MSYYIETKVANGDFNDTLNDLRSALQQEGFGVLSEIDLAEVMKRKAGVDLPPYHILGVCNPAFAAEAIGQENRIGVLLPCNVVVRKMAHSVEVLAVDPVTMLAPVGREELEPIAQEVRRRLVHVLKRVAVSRNVALPRRRTPRLLAIKRHPSTPPLRNLHEKLDSMTSRFEVTGSPLRKKRQSGTVMPQDDRQVRSKSNDLILSTLSDIIHFIDDQSNAGFAKRHYSRSRKA